MFIQLLCHALHSSRGHVIRVSAEVHKTLKEMDLAIQRLERQKENLQQKLAQTEKDLQLALKQEQQAHEEDVERLSKERVRTPLTDV